MFPQNILRLHQILVKNLCLAQFTDIYKAVWLNLLYLKTLYFGELLVGISTDLGPLGCMTY